MSEKKKGIFDKIFDLVSEDDEATTPSTGTPVPTPTAPSAAPRPLQPTSTMPSGNVDPATASALNETVLQQTPAVFTTFQQLLTRFGFMKDDTQRYQAAIAALETTGKGTKAQLKAALAERLNALSKAKTMFDSALEEEMQSSVGTKADQVARFEERIAQLEQEQAKLVEDRNALQSEIDVSTAKLKVTKTNFEITFQSVSQKIADENQRVAVYLN